MAGDYALKCRTCLSEPSVYHQIYDYVDENCKISEMLDSIVPQINVKTTSQFSSLLCLECVEKLLTSYKFQQLCIETNNCLYGFLRSVDCETKPKLENILHASKDNSVLKIKEEFVEAGCYESEKPSEHFEFQSSNDELQSNFPIIESDSSISGEYEDQCRELQKTTSFQCLQCPQSFEKQNSLSAHYKIHKNNQNFVVTELNTETALNNNTHVTSNNKLITPNGSNDAEQVTKKCLKFPCEVCGKLFKRPSCLRKHGKVHSLDRPYACKICQYRFDDTRIFKNHMFQHVKRSSFAKTLKAHASQNNNETIKNINLETFKCTICTLNFLSMGALARHFKIRHPQGEKHKCNVCEKEYIFHYQLLKHLNCHKPPKKIKCQICGNSFRSNNKLKQHMRVHDSNLSSQSDKISNANIEEEIEDAPSKPVKKLEEMEMGLQQDENSPTNYDIQNDSGCSISEAQSLLYEIVKDVEVQCKELSGTTTIQCRHCHKSFDKQTSLAAHTKVHKKTELKKNVSDRKSESLIKDVDDISLPNYLQQNSNILTELHSDETTVEAVIDENSNSNNQPVIKTEAKRAKHIRKEKRYVCKLCGKKFERSYNLRRHCTVHSSNRLYECEICKHRFAEFSSLKSHLDRQACLDKYQRGKSPGGCKLTSSILDPLKVETNMEVKKENEDELLKSENYLESERKFLSEDSINLNDVNQTDTDFSN